MGGERTQRIEAPPSCAVPRPALVGRKLYVTEVGFLLPTNKMQNAIIIFKIFANKQNKIKQYCKSVAT